MFIIAIVVCSVKIFVHLLCIGYTVDVVQGTYPCSVHFGVLDSSNAWATPTQGENMSVNKIILVARLGQKPEQRASNSGNAFTTFSVATNERKKGQDGEWEDHTEWHNIICFGRTAELCAQYLDKGRQVYIEGRIQTRKYDKDGVTHYRTEIVAQSVDFIGSKDDAQPTQHVKSRDIPMQNSPPKRDRQEYNSSNLPF